jgi:hypothetical protein
MINGLMFGSGPARLALNLRAKLPLGCFARLALGWFCMRGVPLIEREWTSESLHHYRG